MMNSNKIDNQNFPGSTKEGIWLIVSLLKVHNMLMKCLLTLIDNHLNMDFNLIKNHWIVLIILP